MILSMPRYIAEARIQTTDLKYVWDEWNLGEIFKEVRDEAFYDRINEISFRANTALAIAIAEWIIWRYDSLSNDDDPHLYLEAAWAAVVDSRYNSLLEPDHDNEWQGPIRGPMSLAIMLIKDAIAAEERELEVIPTLNMSNLAEYTLPDTKAYLEWRDHILEHRLEKLFPLDPDETRGDVVPRELFDPQFAFQANMTESLVNSYLAKLSKSSNYVLNTPAEMATLRFPGKPFVFDIQEDRDNRLDW